MTTKHTNVEQMLVDFLPANLDGHMNGEGFRRSERSLEYSRRLSAGTQHLRFTFDVNPRYKPGALAHVLPRVQFIYPALNQRTLDMMVEMPSLGSARGVTINEQLHNAAPRDVRTLGMRWYIFEEPQSAYGCLQSISDFVQHWTLPFMNRYTTVEALVEGFEQHDECLPQDRRFLLFIVAAYTMLNRPDKSMEVLESNFGRPGARRDYANAYEYVGNLLLKP